MSAVKKTSLLIALIAVLVFPIGFGVNAQDNTGTPDFRSSIDAEMVMKHIRVLSVDIGARLYGTEAEAQAAQYIREQLDSWGYQVEMQSFETRLAPCGQNAKTVTSQNVIATRPGDDQVIVIGAHMDSYGDGTGAGENASGVAALLAAAEVMKDLEPHHTLVFVAFGADEGGCPTGSDYYVFNLGDRISNVVAMLNIDAVGIGTQLYAYAGATVEWGPAIDDPPKSVEGGLTWVRKLLRRVANEMGIAIGLSPANTWAGYTGTWSDHTPFVEAGVPIAYLEAWQWDGAAVNDPWWGVETDAGDVMHTPDDVFENINATNVEMAAEVLAGTIYALGFTADLNTFRLPECVITSNADVNRRSGPALTYLSQGFLARGEMLDADSQTMDANGFVWWHLVDNTWVRSDVVLETGDCGNLPVVSVEEQD
jgi:alkaline phosphatase isozyme conversion protein